MLYGIHAAERRGGALASAYRLDPAGTIPGYARDPDGTRHDAVVFYKELKQDDESPAG